jgi:hypothetical protein
MMNEREKHNSNQTHNLTSGYGSEDMAMEEKSHEKTPRNGRKRYEDNSASDDDYEDEDDV